MESGPAPKTSLLAAAGMEGGSDEHPVIRIARIVTMAVRTSPEAQVSVRMSKTGRSPPRALEGTSIVFAVGHIDFLITLAVYRRPVWPISRP